MKTKVEIAARAASVVLGLAALFASASVQAQQAAKVARIGFLTLAPQSPTGGPAQAVGKALQDLAHNEAPKPFIWTASARDILEKVMRAKAKLKTVQTA